MLHVALVEPEIPPNTGNIIRLCANTGTKLHLVHPLGFTPDDKKLKRAGLDYHQWANIMMHANLTAFLEQTRSSRLLACSTHGKTYYHQINYQPDDVLVFGPETRGLPKDFLASLPREHVIRIPMRPDNRSINLSNAVAIVLYEAWRQQEFIGAI